MYLYQDVSLSHHTSHTDIATNRNNNANKANDDKSNLKRKHYNVYINEFCQCANVLVL